MKLAVVSWRSLFAGDSIDETRNGKPVIAVAKARLAQAVLTSVIGPLLSSRRFRTGLQAAPR
jgi:hypothetical protein